MTIITIRDGHMAVDSALMGGDLVHGSTEKWKRVGNTILAGTGDFSDVYRDLWKAKENNNFGDIGGPDHTLILMQPDGSVRINEKGVWFQEQQQRKPHK